MRLREHAQLGACVLHRLAYQRQAHAPAGVLGHLGGGAEGGVEDVAQHLVVGQLRHIAALARDAFAQLGQHDAAAVVAQAHLHGAVLVVGNVQAQRARFGLAELGAHAGLFDAVHHGVAHQLGQHLTQDALHLGRQFVLGQARSKLHLLAHGLRHALGQAAQIVHHGLQRHGGLAPLRGWRQAHKKALQALDLMPADAPEPGQGEANAPAPNEEPNSEDEEAEEAGAAETDGQQAADTAASSAMEATEAIESSEDSPDGETSSSKSTWPRNDPDGEGAAISYQVFTDAFDEIVPADALCAPEELTRLRHMLDQQVRPYLGMITRLANRFQRRLLARVQPGGFAAVCSCSHHLGRAELDVAVLDAGGGAWTRVHALGPGPDHPVWPGHREGDYLRVNVYQRR